MRAGPVHDVIHGVGIIFDPTWAKVSLARVFHRATRLFRPALHSALILQWQNGRNDELAWVVDSVTSNFN